MNDPMSCTWHSRYTANEALITRLYPTLHTQQWMRVFLRPMAFSISSSTTLQKAHEYGVRMMKLYQHFAMSQAWVAIAGIWQVPEYKGEVKYSTSKKINTYGWPDNQISPKPQRGL